MFLTVEAPSYSRFSNLLDQMFCLRKRVFHDALRWDVEITGDIERDRYDDLKPVYVLWCSEDASTLYGSMRLMPTTGPTLLHDVFSRTIPDSATLQAPGIWEATRCCVDAEAVAHDFPDMDMTSAFGRICLAAAETANTHGIHTLISNYEPHMMRIYSRCGAEISELGRAHGYGRRPVCCGAFAISDRIVTSMRAALGIGQARAERAEFDVAAPDQLAA